MFLYTHTNNTIIIYVSYIIVMELSMIVYKGRELMF